MLKGIREVLGSDEGSRRREDQRAERFLPPLLGYGLTFYTQTIFHFISSYSVVLGIMYDSGYWV